MSGGPLSIHPVGFEGGPLKPLRYLIAHRSSQTGDTLHVAGALALNSLVDVIVVHVSSRVGTTEDLLSFYRQATDPIYPEAAISPDSAAINKRVKVVYASNEEVAGTLYKSLSRTTASDASVQTALPQVLGLGDLWCETPKIGTTPAALKPIQDFTEFKANYLYANYQYMGALGQATSAIAEKFKNPQTADNQKILYTVLANKLTARGLASADIIKGTLKVPKFGEQILPDATSNKTPIILLWARYTGTNTAIAHNPDADSCFQGQKQINELLTSLGFDVVTVGHGPRGSHPFRSQYDVGEFYKQAPITSNRATQQSFFLAMMEKYPGRVYQIGQKTGGMDGAALLGIPTIYLEHKGSSTIARMKKWSDDSLPFYRNVIIEQPAPAIVRVLQESLPNKQYNEWRASRDPLERARARLAAMLYAYPNKSVMNEFLQKPLPEKPSNVPLDKEKFWTDEATREEIKARIGIIVEWVNKLPDTQVQEDKDPASDGIWTKWVQSVNQSSYLGPGKAGYSDRDLREIEEKIQELIQSYSTEKGAVLRTSGAYRTRYEAMLG